MHYTSPDGRQELVAKSSNAGGNLIGFDAKGKPYQVNTWYQPEIETTARATYDKVKKSFTVL
ncbi:hypothetical protein ABT124_23930 [Streptomyces sp. NPDC001982]|uniref:hypothetical protein n=1 Tax=Streptomyces sp. NPDC001982 TaxID=3154405 RepID=UPI00333167F1